MKIQSLHSTATAPTLELHVSEQLALIEVVQTKGPAFCIRTAHKRGPCYSGNFV